MALTFVDSASWVTVGTLDTGNGCYKDVTFTGVAVGDLLVVAGLSESYDFSGGTSIVSTIAGTTSAWTLGSPAPAFLADTDVVAAWATSSSTGTVTVRVTVRVTTANHLGVCGFLLPSADWSGTPSFTTFSADTDGQVSTTVSATSTVLYFGADWTARTMGAAFTPAGATGRVNVYDAGRYSVGVASWTAQAAGTVSYGPTGLSADDVTGVVLVIAEAGAPADTTAPTAPTTVSISAQTYRGGTVTFSGATDVVGVTGYEVFADGISVGTPAASPFVITTLAPSKSYTITVKARDAAGNWSPASSSAPTLTTLAASSVPNYSAASTVVYGTTSVAGTMPAGIVAGDLLVRVVGNKPSTVTPNTPGGWTLLGTKVSTNAAAQAADTGPTRVSVYTRVADGTELTTYTHTLTGNSVVGAQTFLAKNQTKLWEVVLATGENATGTATWSSVLTAIPFAPNDLLIYAGIIPTDVTTPAQFSLAAVTASGITFGTRTEIVEWDTTTGNDMGAFLCWQLVATGTATVAPTVTATVAATVTNTYGPMAMARIRGLALAPDTTAPTVPGVPTFASITTTSGVASWAASTDAVGVFGYEVFKDGVSYGLTNGTSLAITGLSPSTPYAITVRARDVAGNWSAQSSAGTLTTSGGAVTPLSRKTWNGTAWGTNSSKSWDGATWH